VNYQWAHSGPYSRAQIEADPAYRNIILCETPFPVFRCPSADLPLAQHDISTHNWIVMERSPASYIGNATGIVQNQNTRDSDSVCMGQLDGVLFARSKIAIKHILDGTSNTVLVGEAYHDAEGQAAATRVEAPVGGKKDHWPFGGDDIDGTGGPSAARDPSEGLGSTAIPVNFHQQFLGTDVCTGANAASANCQMFQLCFGSAHPGIAQIVRCDGSVGVVEEGIEAVVWRDLGTRDGQVPNP
jgi:hypothetical protein